MTHLNKPRGGNLCGQDGPNTNEIYCADCPDCMRVHGDMTGDYGSLDMNKTTHTPLPKLAFRAEGHAVKDNLLGATFCVADNPEAAMDIARSVNYHDRLVSFVRDCATIARPDESLSPIKESARATLAELEAK